MTCYIGVCGNNLVALNGNCINECGSDYYVNSQQECILCDNGDGICNRLFKGDMQILRVE